ncbi:hypothetical protein GCM10023353_37710 [Tomitella cavernea]|uniref:Superinfection immunity protein n=2 Tax=Tomitella cavernea TaxID=1387982 RepID=A0ABP9D3L0_9ACTN
MLSGSDFPSWLVGLAWASLAIAFGCAIAVAVDVYLRPQPMAVMNLVWPICALFGSVLWLGAYLAWGRAPRPAARAAWRSRGHSQRPAGNVEAAPHDEHVRVHRDQPLRRRLHLG